MIFATENISQILDELVQFRADHPDITPVSKNDALLDLDRDTYELVNGLGNVSCTTARIDGRLVGCAIFMVFPMLHYKDKLLAECVLSFMAEEVDDYSAAYAKLIKAAEKTLKECGAFKVIYNVRKTYEGPINFASLGYQNIETVYEEVLQY
ncbi:MAG TPA: hypothetical protein VKQ29_04760 [Aliidongia sp.]|nr:hypothetical protein [Aliidongia sp.]